MKAYQCINQEIRYYSSYNFVGERIDGCEEALRALDKGGGTRRILFNTLKGE